MKQKIKLLLEIFPQTYSEELKINLKSKREKDIFKWFLASVLFGKPIREVSAIKTYRCFEEHNVLTPKKILETGWHGLVDILDEGTYTRYDFSTADKLLEVMKNLQENYKGSLVNMYKKSKEQKDFENKLKSLGKGIGDVTINIFLRELRNVWNTDPLPSRFTIIAAKNLGLIKSRNPEKALEELKRVWEKNKIRNKTFINFETALLRLGKNYCSKNKCRICGLSGYCLRKRW
jgi:endonuclease III